MSWKNPPTHEGGDSFVYKLLLPVTLRLQRLKVSKCLTDRTLTRANREKGRVDVAGGQLGHLFLNLDAVA